MPFLANQWEINRSAVLVKLFRQVQAHPMQHVNADDQPSAVNQFLLSLNVDDGGSIVEVDGKIMHVCEHDPDLIASIQQSYDQRASGRPLDEVTADIRAEIGLQDQQ